MSSANDDGIYFPVRQHFKCEESVSLNIRFTSTTLKSSTAFFAKAFLQTALPCFLVVVPTMSLKVGEGFSRPLKVSILGL